PGPVGRDGGDQVVGVTGGVALEPDQPVLHAEVAGRVRVLHAEEGHRVGRPVDPRREAVGRPRAHRDERREDAAARERDDLLLERAAGRAVAGERDRVAVVRGPPVRPVVPGLGEDRRLAGGEAGVPAGATVVDVAAEGGLAAVGGVAVAVGESGGAGGRPADAARADARGVGEAAGGAVGRGGRRAAVHRVTDADRAGIGGVAGRRAAGGADAALAGLVTVAD